MSYYEDLTPYNYHHYSERELNIGWLDKEYSFEAGKVPDGFIDRLKLFADNIIFQTKGFHRCSFCEENNYSSNEFRVVGKDGITYASPYMILHYVEAHNYLPPQEFIDAVMNGPLPGSEEYENIIKRLPESWERRKPDPNDEDYEEKMIRVMVDNLSQEVDNQIMKDLLEQNKEFKSFVEAYNKLMPPIYHVGLKTKKS